MSSLPNVNNFNTIQVELDECDAKSKSERADLKKDRETAKAQLEEAVKKNKESDDRLGKLKVAEEKLKAEKDELEVRTRETESLSFALMNRDAEAERADADLKKREENIKALTDEYQTNQAALQTMQKSVKNVAYIAQI